MSIESYSSSFARDSYVKFCRTQSTGSSSGTKPNQLKLADLLPHHQVRGEIDFVPSILESQVRKFQRKIDRMR